ncbi:hypothetical protein NPX13_g4122 [Xylaria arbuscula]|uniref:AA1-like domain-containing protein n=1 Tax=Xylaria arbuscula TaxID=114810 RepID=A0A9W8TMJ4_9PEZI|nr:hypothetical protein NPX13_g4122 [Xylaria arbuscula]
MLLRAQPLLTALVLAGLGLAEPCSEPPSWTIRDLNITTRDEVGENGTAGFQFTYNLTNQTEAITCTLHSNYRCTITGTKNDNSTVIELQIGLGMLYVSVVEDLACGDAGATTFVGSAEASMECSTVPFGPQTCTATSVTLQGASGAAALAVN